MATSLDKPLVWLHGEIKTPPFSQEARVEAGFLLRQVQQGVLLALPHSRSMPEIGSHCHELRIEDQSQTWRIIYRIDPDAIIITEVFSKKTKKTPSEVITMSQKRLNTYDDLTRRGSRR
ncbi:MAG: type II toxin-antitoxin system RelE/ParE family toxin [Candidatus Binatia bacterium]